MDDGELLFVPINPPIQSEFLEIDSENDFNNTEIKIEEKINTCFKYFNEAIKYQHKLEYDGAISLYSKILNSKDLFDLKKEIKRFAEKTVFAIKNNYETNEEQSSENEIETDSEENDFYIEFDQNEILGVYKLLNLANKGLGQSYLATLSMIHKIIAEKLYTPSERDNGCITITKEMIEMNVRPYKIVKIPMWLELQKIIEHVNEENTTIFCFKKESSIKEQTQEPRNRDAMDIDQTMNKLNLDIIINDAFNSFESSLLYDQNDTESWYSAGCCALSLEKFPESINMFLGGLTSSLYSFGQYNTRTRYNDGSACIYLNNRKSILFGNIIQAIKNLLTKTDSSLSESNNQNVTISQIHQIIREALDRERIRKHSDIELVRTCSGLSPLGWRCLEGLFYAYLMQGNYETMHKVAVLGRSVNRVFMAEEETILEANLNLNINIKEYLDKLSWKAGSESEFLHYEKKEILEIPNITDNVFHESESNTSLDYIENNKTAFFKNIILKSHAKNKNMGFIESYISLNSENIINELGNKLINYIDVLHENPKEGKAKDIFKLLTSKINIKLDYNSLMDIDTVKNKSKKTKFLNEKPIDVIDVDNDPILPNKSFNYPSNGKTNQKNSGTVSMSRNNNFIGTINNNSAPNFNQSNISHNRDALNSNSRALGKSASDVGEKRAEVIVTHVLNQNPASGLNTLTKHTHGSKRKSESSDSEQKQFKRRTSSRVRRIAKTNDTIDVQSKSENNTNLGSDSDSFDFTRLGIPKFPTRSSLEIFEDLFTNKNVGINNEHKNNLDNHSANKTSEKDSAQFLQRNNALSLHEAGTDSNEITTNVDSLSHTEIHKTKPPINQSIKINKESSNLSPENVKLAKHLEKASKSLDMLKIEYFHETPNEKNSLPDNIFTAESGRVIWELASKLYKSKNVEPFTRNKKLFQTPKKNKNDETDGNVSHFTRYYLDDLAKERKSEKRFSKLKSKSSKADDKKLEQKFVNEISESNEGVYDVMIKLLFFLVDNPNNNEDGGSHPDSTSTSQQILEQDFGTGKFSQFNQSALNLICCGGGVLVDILEQKIHQYAIEFVSPDLSDYSSNRKINQNQNKYSYKVDYLLDIVVLSLFITEKLSFQIENLIQRLMYMPSKNVIIIDIEQEHPVSVIEEEKEKISQKLIELNELFDSWYSLYVKLRTQIRTIIVVPELKSKSDYLRHLKTFLEFAEISYCWNKYRVWSCRSSFTNSRKYLLQSDNDPSIFVLYSKDSSLSSRFSKMYNTSNLLSKFAFSKNETSTNNKVDQEFVNISKLYEFVDERIDHCEWLGQVDIAQNSIAQNDSYKTIQILESILIQKIVMPLKSCLYGSGKLPKKTSSGVFIVASEILDTLAESYYQTLNTKSTFIILLLKLSILVDQFSNLFKKSYIIDKQEQSKGTMKLFLEISKLLELVHCLPKSPDSLQTGNNELEINYLFEDENVSPLKPLSIYLGYPLVHHKADDLQKAEFSKIVTDYIYYHLGTNLSKLVLIMASCMPVYEKNNIHKFTQSTKTSAHSSYTKLTNQNKDSNKIPSEETSEQSGLSPTDNRHDGIISNLVNVIDNHFLKIPFFKEDIKNCYNWEILLSESIPKDWIKTITLGIRLSAVILERTIGINNQESLSSFTNYLESVHSLMGIFGLCTYKTCASSSNYFKTPAGLSFSTRFETARRGFCDYSLSSSRRIALACLDELETDENQIGDANTENHNSSLTSLEETPRKDQQETESNLKYNVCNSQIGNNNVLDNDSNKRPRSKSSEAISLIEHTLGVFSQAVFCLYDVTIDLEYNGWWIPDNHIRSIGIISHFIESYYLANKELGENSEFLQTLDGEEIDGK
ncbi:hypothetical protein BB559_004242, partial [Furculomyces boomerangus]